MLREPAVGVEHRIAGLLHIRPLPEPTRYADATPNGLRPERDVMRVVEHKRRDSQGNLL